MSPRKAKPPQRLELVYKLDGQLKEIDVFQLAPALMAAGQIIQEGHRELGAKHEIGVNVKPFEKGSFVVDIVLFVKSNFPLLTASTIAINEAIQNTSHVLQTIGFVRSKVESLISAVSKLRGKVDRVERLSPGEFRYSHGDSKVTVNGDVHTLMNNPIIHAGMVHLIGTPVAQEGVTGIDTYLRDDRAATVVRVEKHDAEAFKTFGESTLPEIEPIKEIKTPAHYYLKPKRVSLEGEPDNWSFRVGESLLHVDRIADKGFLDLVKNGDYHLSSNDVIEADLVVTQRVSGSKVLGTTTEIIKVVDYKAAPPNPQRNLFLPGE
jgi:hypothetical protein